MVHRSVNELKFTKILKLLAVEMTISAVTVSAADISCLSTSFEIRRAICTDMIDSSQTSSEGIILDYFCDE